MDKQIKTGSPTITLNFYTRDKTYQIHSKLGDPNSELVSVTTNKDLSSPTGSFQIEMVPKKDSMGLRWDEKIDAFDYVEIKMKGIDDSAESIIMRGLVDAVNYREQFSSGVPQRSVNISGRDLGALLTDIGIYYYPMFATVSSENKNYSPVGVAMARMLSWSPNFEPTPTMPQVFDLFVKKWREAIRITVGKSTTGKEATIQTSEGTKALRLERDRDRFPLVDMIEFKMQALRPELMTVLEQSISYEGSWWNLFQDYSDKPWHEMFIWDAPSGTKLVVRPSRLKDIKGNFPIEVLDAESKLGKDAYPDPITITDVDKISSDITKSNSNMCNFFFAFPELQMLDKMNYMALGITGHENRPWECLAPWISLKQNLDDTGEEPLAWVGRYGLKQYMMSSKYYGSDRGQLQKLAKKDPDHPPPAPPALPLKIRYDYPPPGVPLKQAMDYPQTKKTPSPAIPSNLSKYEAFMEKSCQHYRIDKNFAYGIMQRESHGDPTLVSPVGAVGLMQIAIGYHGKGTNYHPDYTGEFDPERNIDYGVGYLKWIKDKFPLLARDDANGTAEDKIAAAYNGGPTATQTAIETYGPNWLSHMPFETQKYVPFVKNFTEAFRRGEGKWLDQKYTSSLQPQAPYSVGEFIKAQESKFLTWSVYLTKFLVCWYLPNHLFKEGTFQIRGTNKAVVGTYLEDQDEQYEYYIESVTHTFVMFSSYTTNLRVTRGQPSDQGLFSIAGVKSPFYF